MTALLQNLIVDYKSIIQAFMLLLGILMVGITTIKSKGQIVPILGSIIVAALVGFAAFNDKWLGDNIQHAVNGDGQTANASVVTPQ